MSETEIANGDEQLIQAAWEKLRAATEAEAKARAIYNALEVDFDAEKGAASAAHDALVAAIGAEDAARAEYEPLENAAANREIAAIPLAVFDVSGLPEKFRNNWHIYKVLRADALGRYAKTCADAAPGLLHGERWIEAFDAASVRWNEANPDDPMWASGKWPEEASVFLGNAATEEARRLFAAANRV